MQASANPINKSVDLKFPSQLSIEGLLLGCKYQHFLSRFPLWNFRFPLFNGCCLFVCLFVFEASSINNQELFSQQLKSLGNLMSTVSYVNEQSQKFNNTNNVMNNTAALLKESYVAPSDEFFKSTINQEDLVDMNSQSAVNSVNSNSPSSIDDVVSSSDQKNGKQSKAK